MQVDRDSARTDGTVEEELFELFINLGATDEQADYTTIYASGKMGWATDCVTQAEKWRTNPPGLDFAAYAPCPVASTTHAIPPPPSLSFPVPVPANLCLSIRRASPYWRAI